VFEGLLLNLGGEGVSLSNARLVAIGGSLGPVTETTTPRAGDYTGVRNVGSMDRRRRPSAYQGGGGGLRNPRTLVDLTASAYREPYDGEAAGAAVDLLEAEPRLIRSRAAFSSLTSLGRESGRTGMLAQPAALDAPTSHRVYVPGRCCASRSSAIDRFCARFGLQEVERGHSGLLLVGLVAHGAERGICCPLPVTEDIGRNPGPEIEEGDLGVINDVDVGHDHTTAAPPGTSDVAGSHLSAVE
jgi:hypothetical protein